MAGTLKKNGPEGSYVIAGRLSEVDGPGRRIVRRLLVRRPPPGSDLSVLARFTDLEHLELQHADALDLSVLGTLPTLTSISIQGARGANLRPLEDMSALTSLILYDVESTPAHDLSLSSSLRSLTVGVDNPAVPSSALKRIVDDLDWAVIGDLRSLMLVVGGVHDLPAVELDLSFLRRLQHLERLDLPMGIVDVSPTPSPICPPFPGLSPALRHARFEVDNDAAAVQQALAARMGVDARGHDAPAVSRRPGGPQH